MNKSEQGFLSLMAERGFTLISQPTRLRLSDTTYRPDFYCIEEKCYYEVVGTRQAYHANKNKYKELTCAYPNIQFRIVRPDGTDYKKPKIARVKIKSTAKRGRPNSPGGRGQVMSFYASPQTEEAIRQRADAEDKTISAVISDAVNAEIREVMKAEIAGGGK